MQYYHYQCFVSKPFVFLFTKVQLDDESTKEYEELRKEFERELEHVNYKFLRARAEKAEQSSDARMHRVESLLREMESSLRTTSGSVGRLELQACPACLSNKVASTHSLNL
jgi:ElaB/YqjD/DUF883 family membrane-anchored ribosome-binding protein